MTALNPVHTVGKQLMEVLALHRPELGRSTLRQHALEMLEKCEFRWQTSAWMSIRITFLEGCDNE